MLDNKNLKLMMAKHIEKDINRENLTWSEKVSDAVTYFLGTWKYFFIVVGIIIFYVFIQKVYPFDIQLLYLNFALSYSATAGQNFLQMAGNRQAKKDRNHMEIDLQVNIETKKLLEEVNKKMDNQQQTILSLQNEIKELKEGDIDEDK